MLKAFTCTGPYAMLILSGMKKVENRYQMPLPSSGRCAMSISKSFSHQEYSNFVQWANSVLGYEWSQSNLWDWDVIKHWRGCVVATMDYTATSNIPNDDKLRQHCAYWNEGYSSWWFLSNIKRLKSPVPCRGNVGMWQMDEALAESIYKAEIESEG